MALSYVIDVYRGEVEPEKIRLVTSGEFVRAYNHSAWQFYCRISKYKVIRKFSKAQQKNVYFLWFPISKLLELINGRFCEKTDFGYDITLKPEEIPAEDGYETWTKEAPVEAASRADASKVRVCQGRLRAFGEVTEDCLWFYPDVLGTTVVPRPPESANCLKSNGGT